MLCAFLLGVAWPTLAALPGLPGRVLAGDVYVITQGSGAGSIEGRLVALLAAEAWAELVSPEILAFGTLRGEPVVVRGVSPEAFIRIEGGRWIQPPPDSGRGAFAGDGLARRLGLEVGEHLSFVGSTVPRLGVVRVDATFATDTPANDELLVGHAVARPLTGLGPDAYHSIRVKARDATSLLAFLHDVGASVHVYGPGIPRADIHSDSPSDERLASLLLRFGTGAIPQDYVATALAEATNSVRVVVFGFGALIGLLVALGIHAVQARAFADRRAAVGVLRALGAGNRWMRRRAIRETIPMALAAGALGAAIGLLANVGLRPAASLVVFGHEVRASFDAVTFLFIIAAVVAASAVSQLLLLARALRERPMESIQDRSAQDVPPALEVVLRG